MIVDHFLHSRQVTVYIDDLDRGWGGVGPGVRRISALLNAVRDLSRDSPGLKFRISLRSDVYYLVRTSDESTDKIEGSVIWQTWTNHEIFVLLIKRIETFFGRGLDERNLLKIRQRHLGNYLDSVMEPRFLGAGHWENAPMYKVLMSLIRRRPRDLIKLCTLAARDARRMGGARISTVNLTNVFREYSEGRVRDTINEFRSELPDIDRLLMNMKPNKKEKTARLGYTYTTGDLVSKIRNISEMGAFYFADGRSASPKALLDFMYKVNFLTARKDADDEVVRRYFEESQYLSSEVADFGFDWEVHPAYRWALQPDSVTDIFQTLKLSADDAE